MIKGLYMLFFKYDLVVQTTEIKHEVTQKMKVYKFNDLSIYVWKVGKTLTSVHIKCYNVWQREKEVPLKVQQKVALDFVRFIFRWPCHFWG